MKRRSKWLIAGAATLGLSGLLNESCLSLMGAGKGTPLGPYTGSWYAVPDYESNTSTVSLNAGFRLGNDFHGGSIRYGAGGLEFYSLQEQRDEHGNLSARPQSSHYVLSQ